MIDFKKYIPTNRNIILFGAIVVLVLLLMQQCNRTETLKGEVETAKMVANRNFNNYKASQDTIKFERNRNGELVAIKLAYEFDINTLTTENKKVIGDYQKTLGLNKDLKGVNSLLRTEIKLKDSIINAKSSVATTSDSTATISANDFTVNKTNGLGSVNDYSTLLMMGAL
jgi:hypothetical protein